MYWHRHFRHRRIKCEQYSAVAIGPATNFRFAVNLDKRRSSQCEVLLYFSDFSSRLFSDWVSRTSELK